MYGGSLYITVGMRRHLRHCTPQMRLSCLKVVRQSKGIQPSSNFGSECSRMNSGIQNWKLLICTKRGSLLIKLADGQFQNRMKMVRSGTSVETHYAFSSGNVTDAGLLRFRCPIPTRRILFTLCYLCSKNPVIMIVGATRGHAGSINVGEAQRGNISQSCCENVKVMAP